MDEGTLKKLLALGAAGLTLLGLTACYPPAAPGALPAGSPRFRLESQRAGDNITIDDATLNVIIDITSERGIGSAEIVRTGPAPESLTINLHLKGLEEVSLSWPAATVIGHVSSGDGSVRIDVAPASGQPAAIDDASPYWMPIRIESDPPQVPLASGYFQVTAPRAFIEAAPERFTLKWIDFYR